MITKSKKKKDCDITVPLALFLLICYIILTQMQFSGFNKQVIELQEKIKIEKKVRSNEDFITTTARVVIRLKGESDEHKKLIHYGGKNVYNKTTNK